MRPHLPSGMVLVLRDSHSEKRVANAHILFHGKIPTACRKKGSIPSPAALK